jgi:hypothetical protein
LISPPRRRSVKDSVSSFEDTFGRDTAQVLERGQEWFDGREGMVNQGGQRGGANWRFPRRILDFIA